MPSTANSPGTASGTGRSAKSQKARLWRHIILFGLAGGIIITLLKWTEYRYLVIENSIEIYGGLTAATFSAFGIWLGLRLTRKQIVVKEVHVSVPAGQPFVVNSRKQEELEITPRELEILELMAKGMKTPEIAEMLFVGENAVKPLSRRVFDKLVAKRGKQAVQLGKEFGL